jgi:hypothetical protein
MATCFDSTESSSGLPKNRSNVSIGIPECTIKFWYIGSVLWKAWWWLSRVETCCHKNILSNKLLCLTEIYTLYEFYGSAVEVSILLVCIATSLSDWCLTFRDGTVISSSRVEMSHWKVWCLAAVTQWCGTMSQENWDFARGAYLDILAIECIYNFAV